MSERAFFSLRYALPGYTFILMVILVAYPELEIIFFKSEQVALVAALLAFLSLLGGGALGFLISQGWYWIFNQFFVANYEGIPKMIKWLRKEYGLVKDKHHQIVFVDYIYRLHENKELKSVNERRYDLMHVSGSTIFSIIIGSTFEFLIRSGLFFTKITIKDAIELLSNISLDLTKIWTYDVGVILIVVILLIVLFFTLQHAKKLHAMPFEIAVNEVVNSKKFPVWKAKRVFPSHYFTDENRTNGK